MATLREIFDDWTPDRSITELEDVIFLWAKDYGEQVREQIATYIRKMYGEGQTVTEILTLKLRPPAASRRTMLHVPTELPEGSPEKTWHSICPNCHAKAQVTAPSSPAYVTCQKCGRVYQSIEGDEERSVRKGERRRRPRKKVDR